MFGIGPMELMMILVVALLVFGPKRVPELARTLGRGLAEFRKASNDLRHSLALDDLQKDLNSDPTQTIHRPNGDGLDRPAQAGDNSSPPTSTSTSTTKDSGAESESTDAASAGTNADADADARTRETDGAQPETPHPGELPLNEEHDYAHHGESGPDGKGNQTASSETATDARGSETSDRTDKSAGQAADRPIDSELGNVPVGNTKSSSRPRG